MSVLYIAFLMVLSVLAFLARKESDRTGKIFYKSSAFIVRIWFLYYKNSLYKNVARDIQTLYPGKNIEQKVRAYYIEKLRMVLLVVFIGNVLSLGVFLLQWQGGRVNGEGHIVKNTREQGAMLLQLETEPTVGETFSITVEPRSLTAKEADILAEKVFQQLVSVLPDQNNGVERITQDINLVSRLESYPFRIDWESDHPDIVKSTGEVINDQVGQEGMPVKITAHLTYEDRDQRYQYQRTINLQVYPPDRTPEEQRRQELLDAIEKAKEETAYQKVLQLPKTVRGMEVRWREKIGPDSFYLWIMACLSIILIFVGRDKDIHKKVVRRNRQLEREYPELIGKLVLFLGAGLTVKNAWKRMVGDYAGKAGGETSILYEEMSFSWHEMENGVSEDEVYLRFGRRVGGTRYLRLSGLLCNYLQKGNKNLLLVLRSEADIALEERKNTARVLGEEMGNKLLFPMMLMLLVVMVMIMVPAYAAF